MKLKKGNKHNLITSDKKYASIENCKKKKYCLEYKYKSTILEDEHESKNMP